MSGTPSIMVRAAVRATRGTVLTAGVLILGALLVPILQAPILQAPILLAPSAKVAHDADDEPAKATASRARDAAETGIVKLDEEGREKGGIETATPKAVGYQDQTRAYATVLALDKLTPLFNASLTADAQLRQAQARLTASRTAGDRARNLLKVFPTAVSQVETAEALQAQDALGVDAARTQMETLRNSAVQDWGPVLGEAIVTRSPLAERLVLRKASLIQISPREPMREAPPRVALTLGDGSSLEADYVAAAPQIDPKTQAAGFLYVVPATPQLIPGATLVMSIPKGAAQAGLGIPSSAVVWQAGHAWVYLKTAPDTFERRAIDARAAPMADGGYVVPATSVPADRTLVVAGAQALLSEESKARIQTDDDDK